MTREAISVIGLPPIYSPEKLSPLLGIIYSGSSGCIAKLMRSTS